MRSAAARGRYDARYSQADGIGVGQSWMALPVIGIQWPTDDMPRRPTNPLNENMVTREGPP